MNKHSVTIGQATEIYKVNDKKVKFTYEVGNAYERFRIEIFDGDKLNQVGNIRDIGGIPDSGAYSLGEMKVRFRYDKLIINAKSYIKTLLS
jgi:hypothetical protein